MSNKCHYFVSESIALSQLSYRPIFLNCFAIITRFSDLKRNALGDRGYVPGVLSRKKQIVPARSLIWSCAEAKIPDSHVGESYPASVIAASGLPRQRRLTESTRR